MENSQLNETNIKETHNDIENRRREKFQIETSDILDKNTTKMQVTNKAVHQNMREILNNGGGILTNTSFLSDHELKMLLTEASDGFLFIARCDNGKIIYVSDTIVKILNVRQDEWITTTLFSQIHSADIQKVKEQLIPPKSSIIIDDTGINSCKTDFDEAKRTFTCRMKLRSNYNGRGKFKNFLNSKNNHCYTLVQCNGLIRKCPLSNNQELEQGTIINEEEYYLVASVRIQITSVPNNNDLDTSIIQQFTSKHSFGGNFIFVDQRITTALGYTTVELLGKCFFDFFYRDDRRFIKETFKFIPTLKGKPMTVTYRFWSKSGYWVWLRIIIYVYVHQYTNEMEHIICDCTVLPHDVGDNNESNLQYFNMALTTRGSSNYKQLYKDRLIHSDNSSIFPQSVEILTNNDGNNFLLSETFPNDLYNTIQNNTNPQYTNTDWSQFSGTIPPIGEWALPPVVELFPQQETWPLLQNNWPINNSNNNDNNTNELNTLCSQEQLEMWQLPTNDENLIWPRQYLDNINSFSTDFSNLRLKSNNWTDIENFENFQQLSTINSNISRQNQLYGSNGEFSGINQQQQQQQHLWTDDQTIWMQNNDNIGTKALNEFGLTDINPTQSLIKSNNITWKGRDQNLFQIPQYTTIAESTKILFGDQSKLPPRLPDLIEQVLHVDQPYKQGASFQQTEC